MRWGLRYRPYLNVRNNSCPAADHGGIWGGSVSDMPNMRLPLVLTPSTSHVEHTYTRTYRRSRNRVSVLKERNVILSNRVSVLMMGNMVNPKSRLSPHEAKHAFTESCLGP